MKTQQTAHFSADNSNSISTSGTSRIHYVIPITSRFFGGRLPPDGRTYENQSRDSAIMGIYRRVEISLKSRNHCDVCSAIRLRNDGGNGQSNAHSCGPYQLPCRTRTGRFHEIAANARFPHFYSCKLNFTRTYLYINIWARYVDQASSLKYVYMRALNAKASRLVFVLLLLSSASLPFMFVAVCEYHDY